jgi:hypothetical protein
MFRSHPASSGTIADRFKQIPDNSIAIPLPAAEYAVRYFPRKNAEVLKMSFLSGLLKRETMHDLQEVLVNLEFLTDAEERISEFYRLCATAAPKEAEFWNDLADQELKHAENVRGMIKRITRDPKQFKPATSFSTVTIRLFIVEMQGLTERLNAGHIPHDELFPIALEIENSIVEICYGQIVKTEDGIFNMLARHNDNESAMHRSSILSKIGSPLLQPQSANS